MANHKTRQYCGFCHLTFVFANTDAKAAAPGDAKAGKAAPAAAAAAKPAAAAAKPAKGKK
jgi:hypothetical protein